MRFLLIPICFTFVQVIAGQGTIGMEILKTRNGKPLDIVFACCGGGGLVAGIAAYIKQVRPEVKVRSHLVGWLFMCYEFHPRRVSEYPLTPSDEHEVCSILPRKGIFIHLTFRMCAHKI